MFKQSYFSAFPLYECDHLSKGIPIFSEEVGDGDGDTATDSHHAVDQDICFPSAFLDEFKSGLKVLAYLVLFAVLYGNVQIVRDFLFLMR